MKKEDLKNFKKQLEEEKKKIIEYLNSFAKKEPDRENWNAIFPEFDGSSAREEEVDEVEEYTTLLSLEISLENKLKEINSALERIEKGTFGICEKCKREIEIERLEANPAERYCKNCGK
jgi:RNA polymerase-binding transcription factor DksA